MNFLDISIILHSSGLIETDIYYKPTNHHDYLDYKSHHPDHIKKNIPFNLAKRIIVFVSNEEREKIRLNELQTWLRHCNYPSKVISRAFRNAQLRGPAPSKAHEAKKIPLITTYYNNFHFDRTIKLINNHFNSFTDPRLREIFGNANTILSLRQPPNLLRQLTKAEFGRTNPPKENGIFKCTNKRCILCKSYLQPVKSFICANGFEWHIKSHITCKSVNVNYYLECLSCNAKETYTGKTTIFRSRLNVHISSCRTGRSTNKFDLHVFNCGTNPKTEPYFRAYAYISHSSPKYLLTYEKYLHRQKFDTMN